MNDSHTSKRTYEPTIQHRTPRGRKALKSPAMVFVTYHDGTHWHIGDEYLENDVAWIFAPVTIFSDGKMALRFDANNQFFLHVIDPSTGNVNVLLFDRADVVLLAPDSFSTRPEVTLTLAELEALISLGPWPTRS